MRRTRLPSADAPLELPDGSHVAPSAAQPYSSIEVPAPSAAQRIVAGTRRKLADLPALPKQMNSYAVVMCYTASGLSDTEIAVATGFTEQQIGNIRKQAAYASLESMIIEAVKNEAASAVKDVLIAGELNAAKQLTQLIDSPDERIALAAAKDVLDRGGHKAAEKVDVRAQMLNIFRIEVIDKRDDAMPVIDMEAE